MSFTQNLIDTHTDIYILQYFLKDILKIYNYKSQTVYNIEFIFRLYSI